jgi:hypothetical protein
MPPYELRAALAVVLWSELLGDTTGAESCVAESDLLGRRSAFRSALRGFLRGYASVQAPDKWVQRAFWSSPPPGGSLRGEMKDPLLDWVASLGVSTDAVRDLDNAVRSLFFDGSSAFEDLVGSRPGLVDTLTPLVLGRLPCAAADWIVGLSQVWGDGILPMYATDARVENLVWMNASFCSFMGIAEDRLRSDGFDSLIHHFRQMVPPEERQAYHELQTRVLAGGAAVGRAHLFTPIDLALRSWTHGQPTPPWSGRVYVNIYAHFLFSLSRERLGSLVVYHPQRLD